MIQAKAISIEVLDKIISSKKIDLRKSFTQIEITKEFLEQYIHSLIVAINEDRNLKNQILDNCDMHIVNDDLLDDPSLPEELLNQKRKIIINSRTIDAMAEAYNLAPNDIEEAIARIIAVSSFGSVYEIEDIDTNADKRKTLLLKSLVLDYDDILKILEGNLTAEEVEIMKQNTKEICRLEIHKTNFSNAIALYDEYINRLSAGTLFDKDFITNVGKLIKIECQEMSFDAFLKICDKSLVLAYDLLNIVLSYSYNKSQKKSQFSIKIS